MQRITRSLLTVLIGCAICSSTLPGAESASAVPKPAITSEQATALETLKRELARLDPMVEQVSEPEHKGWVTTQVNRLKTRYRELEQAAFDQVKYDELRFDINIEYQRLAVWLRPPLLPPKAKAK